MIRLTKNTYNEVTVTVTELTTIINPSYFISFKNKLTKEVVYCLLGDNLSSNTDYYDKFLITDTVDPDRMDAEVDLMPGQYIYNIYQLTPEQLAGLDFDTIVVTNYECVEQDCQCTVYAPALTNAFYDSAPLTNTVYEGQ